MNNLPHSQSREYFIMMQVLNRPPIEIAGPYDSASVATYESASLMSNESDQTVRYFVEPRDKS
ncbi:hypothetical protein [Vibrio phage LP.1]|nr:hypothetical protein [Vibrio phage LP.1]